MSSLGGAAVGHGSTAYFSHEYNVYSYTVPGNKWTKLPECKYECFALAVVNDALTTVGGMDKRGTATNALLSLSGSSWEEVLLPMPTERLLPAAVTPLAYLVVAGGETIQGSGLATVEVLNTKTLQWSTASSFPETARYPQIATCGGCLYLGDTDNSYAFSCSVKDLLKSTTSSDSGSVWTGLANLPTPYGYRLATLRGRVLAIGGVDNDYTPTGAIHCYDVATNSWTVMGEMPTIRANALAAVLLSDELVVIGRKPKLETSSCFIAEI
jgi:hypothetical protein